MAKYVKVAKRNQIPEGSGLAVEAEGREIGLFLVDGRVCAIDPVCPHAGGPLTEGGVNGRNVMCPWHGWEFSLETGICDFNDAICLKTYKVKEEGGDIFVEV